MENGIWKPSSVLLDKILIKGYQSGITIRKNRGKLLDLGVHTIQLRNNVAFDVSVYYDLTGVEVQEKKIVSQGTQFRAYVLVVLPTGDANILKKAKESARLQEQVARRAPEAFKELD